VIRRKEIMRVESNNPYPITVNAQKKPLTSEEKTTSKVSYKSNELRDNSD
jgi:hypothetical protein